MCFPEDLRWVEKRDQLRKAAINGKIHIDREPRLGTPTSLHLLIEGKNDVIRVDLLELLSWDPSRFARLAIRKRAALEQLLEDWDREGGDIDG